MATAKTARKIVTTVSAPPSVCMTSDGSSDSTTAPTSQKMLVTTAQRHSRVSAHNSPSNLPVERRMLGSIASSGAARAVVGMNRLAPQHRTAKSIIVTASDHGIAAVLHRHAAGDRAAEDREKGRALDERVAGRQLLPRCR